MKKFNLEKNNPFTQEQITEIRHLREDLGISIDSIANIYKCCKQTLILYALLEKPTSGGLVQCPCCGTMYDAVNRKGISLYCSKKCGTTMGRYYRAISKGEHPIHPSKTNGNYCKSNDDRTELCYYDEYLDMFIYKKSKSFQRLIDTANDAYKAGKSYGNYIADETARIAKKKGMTYAWYIEDQHKEFCDTHHREIDREIVHMLNSDF